MPLAAYVLERKSNPDFCRQAVRHRHSAWSDEVGRFPKGWLSNVRAEIIAEVSAIRQIENLKDRLKIGTLANLEVLGDACIQLEERLASKVVKGCESTLAGT